MKPGAVQEVWMVGEREVPVDGPWCGSCLNQELAQALRWAEIDHERAQRGEGLFRVRARERSPAGDDGVSPGRVREARQARIIVCALHDAVTALVDIAKLDDGTAGASIALEASEKIKVELDSLGGDA